MLSDESRDQVAAVARVFAAHAAVFEEARQALPRLVARAAAAVVAALRSGGRVLLFGNGGSFSDALHIEGELVNRFRRDRGGLPAICLGAGQAGLTATANDYSYADLFARLLRAHARPGDVAIGLTTSGDSENVVRALAAARELNVTTIAFTGRGGGRAAQHADILVSVPSDETARVQEVHGVAAHALCALVEDALFPPSP
ncbi:MAG: SIS domain-containing protein [Planctomycetes bacterium]|nr:SIS domain-containing protein [Planctomycetota bacterium]